MPRYRYKARDMDGKAVEAVVEAANDDALERDLARQGLMLISSAPAERKKALFNFSPGRNQRLSANDLVFFTMELGTSYSAGLPILNTLEDMAMSAETRGMREIAKGLAERIRNGSSLAESLSAYPRAFPTLYCELVAASEKTGKLDTILEDIVRFLEWQRETRGQIVSATIYPAAMLGAVIMLTLVLTLFVFPRFLSQFASSGIQLPLPTKILMGLEHLFVNNKSACIAFIILAPATYMSVRNVKPVRWQIDRYKLKIPVIGPLITKVLMSRFAHNLAMMLASGLDFGSSLRMCERLMENVVLTQLVQDARVGVEQGKPLSDAMARGNYMPSLVRRMLKLGESTGEMEKSLENVSKYYDREIPKAIKGMFAVLEPLILVVMACVVLFMASAVLLPMYQMITAMGGK
jgi:type II secretory pathway component PulF